MEKTANSLSLVKTYKAPVETLWKVITEREHLKQWYFDFAEDWELKVGQQFDWSAGDNECNQWLHRGVMLEIIPNKKLSHSWEYPGHSGTSVVTWELHPIDKNNTELHFSHVFTVPFDVTEPAFKRENFEMGWNEILNNLLVNYLGKL
ncbi:SRPBCC family protein [Flavobacterium terrisoli]|uniref:SRPBCC family protein n=1 Tax=Flavobacterium terrisoli TaxID=3242195 RepID=UPI0025432910|nr:SRPBCC domain-containing protein [Flavobacterium buctense]